MVWRSAVMTACRLALLLFLLSCVAAALTPAFAYGVTERVSVDSAGIEGNAWSERPSISADGRYVAFESDASNLVAGDNNGARDVFVRDRLGGTTERVSVSSAEEEGNSASEWSSISADGRYVAFQSEATNLVEGDTNGIMDVFVRDRLAGTTERVSVSSAEEEGNSASELSSISADGRYVAFQSEATNLVEGDSNAAADILVRDRLSGETERVSVSTAGGEGDSDSWSPSISADARYVAFQSYATNLVEGDSNGLFDVFVRDRLAMTTERVSVSSAEAEGNSESGWYPSISADGRYVTFSSQATNLVEGDTNGMWDVFVRDRLFGTTERVSVSSAGAEGYCCSVWPAISADGRYVAFDSWSTNLVPGDANAVLDTFVRGPAPILQVLLEVHPNERAPGTNTGQVIGVAPWTRPGPTQPSMYWWEHYRFAGSDALWIQVCAQNWNATQNGTGDDDNIRMRIDGFVPVDYDLIQNGPWGAYQWKGSKENGHRWTLRFLYLGASPIPVLHALQFEADETPVIWWIKVTDLEPGVIEAF
jgi:Tol biopolymer transport system component